MRDKQDHNALYYALKNGRLELVEILVEHDDPTDEDGVTALMRAAARGDAKMTELLAPVQKGMKDKNGDTAFMHALKNKHTDTAMVLGRHEDSSWTPLMHAAADGDVGTVKKHLSDKDTRNSEGDTALIIAARAGHKDIVELLDPTDKDGVTALMRAADRNDLATARALAPLQGGQRASGDVMINNRIIYKGTALMRAAARGHAEIVDVLLEKEGGMRNRYGETALMKAAENGHANCTKLLLEKEGGMKGDGGRTALMVAAGSGHLECVNLLLEREDGIQTDLGETALMWAALNGHPDCVKLLLEKEGGIQGNDGRTALMWTVRNNQIECAKLLAERERDINRDKLLDMAMRMGNEGIIAILSES
ncbi:NEK, Kinase [Giardia lamblia P15]|uniref:NEK, Kinase n=1 Tax=Giardia intestinalis (strain P15) TaxID=658858 RepID=E1F8Q1_GIAIA|nr:NEK, Kinase [Giardia lamblia P15]